MEKKWISWMLLAGALALCPAVEAAEQISAKLLEEAKAKVSHIERLISAAKEGNAESQFRLGLMIGREGRTYVNRQIEKIPNRDFNESNLAGIKSQLREVEEAAVEWFLRAAYQGHEDAQWFLSLRYEDFDIVKAYAWNRFLFRKNGRDTISNRNEVEKPRGEWLRAKMTADQVAEAEHLSHQIEREIARRGGTSAK